MGVYTLLYLINGYLRTPKHEAFIRCSDFINNYIDNYKNTNNSMSKNIVKNIDYIEVKPIDTSDIGSNAWLAGMTDADGNYSINLRRENGRSDRAIPYYRLELRQNYNNSSRLNNLANSYLDIMSAIASYFNVKLYSRDRNIKFKDESKVYSSYTVMVANTAKNIKVKEYFYNYPLLSSKRLDFLAWAKLLELIEKEGGQSINTFNTGVLLRKDFNSTRTTYTWNHLNNSYLEK